MYWYSTAVCICLYSSYIFYLETCTFVHGSLLYMHITCVTTAVCMESYVYTVCMIITYRYSGGKNQPDKVANPPRGQLAEQGK